MPLAFVYELYHDFSKREVYNNYNLLFIQVLILIKQIG